MPTNVSTPASRNPSEPARDQPLAALLRSLRGATVTGPLSEQRTAGITADSGEVERGWIFVAIRGETVDGHDFVPQAIERGASAVVVEEEPASPPGVPIVKVPNGRRALAQLSAAWHGHPARALEMVGITGTVGKTSTLAVLESILARAGRRVGTLGSLGVRINGRTLEETGFTAPDPPVLQGALARAHGAGCTLVAMEATSHALVQDRLTGIRFDLGILTNLVPLEHQDYHGTFREYLDAKRLFFKHLRDCAPLIFNADNRAARRMVADYPVQGVGCGTARAAVVRIEEESVHAHGTALTLNIRRPIPRIDAEPLPPVRIPLKLRLLGRSNLSNVALAAAAALSMGASPDAVREALAAIDPPPRRMQIVHDGRFLVIDDTVGHPDSISAVFEVVERLASRRVHIAFAVRGQRGTRINRQSARTLAIWCERDPPATLVITRSIEAADERNRVDDREMEAFTGVLRGKGVRHSTSDRLDQAIHGVMEAAEDDDLVLLLGAQGMDQGHDIMNAWLRGPGAG